MRLLPFLLALAACNPPLTATTDLTSTLIAPFDPATVGGVALMDRDVDELAITVTAQVSRLDGDTGELALWAGEGDDVVRLDAAEGTDHWLLTGSWTIDRSQCSEVQRFVLFSTECPVYFDVRSDGPEVLVDLHYTVDVEGSERIDLNGEAFVR